MSEETPDLSLDDTDSNPPKKKAARKRTRPAVKKAEPETAPVKAAESSPAEPVVAETPELPVVVPVENTAPPAKEPTAQEEAPAQTAGPSEAAAPSEAQPEGPPEAPGLEAPRRVSPRRISSRPLAADPAAKPPEGRRDERRDGRRGDRRDEKKDDRRDEKKDDRRDEKRDDRRDGRRGDRRDEPKEDAQAAAISGDEREEIPVIVEPPASEAQGEGGNKRRRRRRRKGGEGEEGGQPQPASSRPELDSEEVSKKAWKIYLSEVSEEGLALITDQDARELSRRSFRLAEIFLEEESRR